LSNEIEKYYFVRTLEPDGRAPKFALPQWKRSPFIRILSKSYTMNEIITGPKIDPVRFTSTGSSEFIEWNLGDNEEIIFSYKHFAGMSESIKLSTIISFRLTSMVLRGVFYYCAKGPGKIIFKTIGKTNCVDESTRSVSFPVGRMIAWRRTAQFDVESNTNHFDVFLSGIYIKPSSPDLILVDADEQGDSKQGLIKFAKKFLLPV
jgi:hypothetical protein